MFDAKSFIRTVYLYLFSLVGLFILIFGFIGLIKLGLTTWVFPEAENYSYDVRPIMLPGEKLNDESDLVTGLENCKETCDLGPEGEEALSEWLIDYREWKEASDNPKDELKHRRQRQASDNFAMIIVGLPLYLFHWTTIKKDTKKKKIQT